MIPLPPRPACIEKIGTPRSLGSGLGFPPLPVGGTYRAWELLCSVCDRVPPTPGRRPFVAGEREGKQDQPNFVARGGRGGPGVFACGFWFFAWWFLVFFSCGACSSLCPYLSGAIWFL